MPNVKTNNNGNPAAFLNYARWYHEAVECLFEYKPHLSDPINALYFHIVELAFKAFLRAHNRDPWGHDIEDLYENCRTLGLKIKSDDQLALGNIVSLLARGNEKMAFRYFIPESKSEPDLKWTREVVGQLLQAVAVFVEPNGPAAPGPAVKFRMVIGRPETA